MRISFYILLFITCSLHAQVTREAVLEKVKAKYASGKAIQFNATYNLYKDFESKKIHQSYKGEYSKSPSNDIYLKINTTEYFLKGSINTQINHDEKIILITGPQQLRKEEYDIAAVLNLFNAGSFKDKNTHWEIELIGKPLSSLPYARIVLYVGKDFLIQKQVFYYNTAMNFSKDYSKPDMKAPRLEIIYSKPTYNSITASRFDYTKYFTIVGQKVKLASQYVDYQLIDKR